MSADEHMDDYLAGKSAIATVLALADVVNNLAEAVRKSR